MDGGLGFSSVSGRLMGDSCVLIVSTVRQPFCLGPEVEDGIGVGVGYLGGCSVLGSGFGC